MGGDGTDESTEKTFSVLYSGSDETLSTARVLMSFVGLIWSA
jgi:hypothetical protein